MYKIRMGDAEIMRRILIGQRIMLWTVVVLFAAGWTDYYARGAAHLVLSVAVIVLALILATAHATVIRLGKQMRGQS
jgi:hypothetical protein